MTRTCSRAWPWSASTSTCRGTPAAGDKYVTVILVWTPIRDGRGPARLLDMIEGRSKAAFKQWLAERPDTWREQVEVVAMDGFAGFKSATSEELPKATAVMDPFGWGHRWSWEWM